MICISYSCKESSVLARLVERYEVLGFVLLRRVIRCELWRESSLCKEEQFEPVSTE